MTNFVKKVRKEEILIIKDKSILKQRHMCIYAQIANKKDFNYLRLVDYLERYSYSAFWGHYLYTPYKLRDYIYAGLVYSLIPRKMIQGDRLNVGKYFLAANQIVGDYARDEHVLTTDIGVPLSNLRKALELVDEMTESQLQIASMCEEMKDMLLQKNRQYGDSVLNPTRFFSHADQEEQIKVRIDDKLNRLVQGNDSLESDDDIIKDLIGYLTLLLVYRSQE